MLHTAFSSPDDSIEVALQVGLTVVVLDIEAKIVPGASISGFKSCRASQYNISSARDE